MRSGGNCDVQHKTNAIHQQLVCPQMSSECGTRGCPGPSAACQRLQNEGPVHPTHPVPHAQLSPVALGLEQKSILAPG